MKEVTITVRTRMTDQYFNEDGGSMVNDIKSGKFQREMTETNGITKVTATIQVVNIRGK